MGYVASVSAVFQVDKDQDQDLSITLRLGGWHIFCNRTGREDIINTKRTHTHAQRERQAANTVKCLMFRSNLSRCTQNVLRA